MLIYCILSRINKMSHDISFLRKRLSRHKEVVVIVMTWVNSNYDFILIDLNYKIRNVCLFTNHETICIIKYL